MIWQIWVESGRDDVDDLMTRLGQDTDMVAFLAYVSPDPDVRERADWDEALEAASQRIRDRFGHSLRETARSGR